jgi:CHAT domain-containing protein
LANAQAVADSASFNYRKTGDLAAVFQACRPARDMAQSAYQQFLAKGDLGNAARSLILVADIDRKLVLEHPEDLQVKQGPIKQKYEDALSLARKAKDSAAEYRALRGLARANMNGKDFATAAEYNSQAMDLAVKSGDIDDLFQIYLQRAELEQNRTNLAAASDYADRALQLSSKLKDSSLLWDVYGLRSDIYNTRADQCDFARNYSLCKQIFDIGLSDAEKALEIAHRQGLTPFEHESQLVVDGQKMKGDKFAQIGALSAQSSKVDAFITKPSDVLTWPHFSSGANPAAAAESKQAIEVLNAAVVNPYDPLFPYTQGELKEWEGKDDEALSDYLRAVDLLENDRRKVGDREGASAFLNDRIEIYYAPALQELDRKRYSQAFSLFERSRARALADLLTTRALSFRTPELQGLFSQSMTLRAQARSAQNKLFDALGAKTQDHDAIQALQTKIDDLQKEDRTLEAKIQQRAPKLAADLGSQPPVTLEATQAAASQGKFDVLYYVVVRDGIVIWHIGENANDVRKVVYYAHQLEKRLAALRSSISDPHAEIDQASATELFLVLVNPVLPLVKTRHLVIVPHGSLSQIPFQVLKDAEHNRYLGETYQISYAPSATILATLNHHPDLAHGRLLAVADPGITNAVAEVHKLAQLYPTRVKVVDDQLVTKTSLKSWTSNYNLLHLSVHGVFDSGSPLLSYLKLQPASGDDGHLTAAEMFGLNIPENSLVVLSACETGRVASSRGNDLLGMVPALIFSGASTLVLSSWTVDAGSTALWMETFYREARTHPPSEAAQLALLAVKSRAEFAHPFYWAPFLVTGQ